MNFYLAALILTVIIFEVNAEKYVISDFAVQKNCSETVTVRIQKYVPYNETDYLNDGQAVETSKTRIKYRYESAEMNKTRAICCEGYQNFNNNQCIPVCTKSCGSHGICFSPQNCVCDEGYSLNLDTQKCVPDCSSKCINGFCTSPDVCSCHEGYRMADDNHTCQPICQNGTDTCSDLEFCTEPGVCRCNQGYARSSLDRKLGSSEIELCKPICENSCINGDCISPNVCECHKNYTRVDESTCERVNLASNFVIPKNCSETKVVKIKKEVPYEDTYRYDEDETYYDYDWRRYRTRTVSKYGTRTLYRTEITMINQTISICCDGYQNYDHQNCLPICSKNCGPHGICSMPDVCICDEGYSMDQLGNCQLNCQFECINGQCTSPNYCSCNEGYHKQLNDYICEKICTGDC